jgi:hypothetical protein
MFFFLKVVSLNKKPVVSQTNVAVKVKLEPIDDDFGELHHAVCMNHNTN